MNIENIKELMDGFDIAALLPDIAAMMEKVEPLARFLLMVGPGLLLSLGLYYFLLGPKEANYQAGYRCRWGMGSVEAWQFTQKLAGILWILLGVGMLVDLALTAGELEGLEVMDLLWAVAQRLIGQAIAAAISCVLINLTVFLRYDLKGRRRYTWAELWRG